MAGGQVLLFWRTLQWRGGPRISGGCSHIFIAVNEALNFALRVTAGSSTLRFILTTFLAGDQRTR